MILLRDGWRVFFLAAGVFAVAAMLVWLLWLGVHAAGGTLEGLPFAPAPHLWHGHEMIFGFATAAMGGFFLTAVPNWTGVKAAPQRFVAAVAALWLAGQAAVWFSGDLPAGLVAAVDLAFLPVLAAKILTQLLARPKPQNLMFLGLIALVWTGDLLVHLGWMGIAATEPQGLRGGMLAVIALIAVLGGRVTPAFTRNALLRAGAPDTALPVTRRSAEIAGIALPIAAALLALAAAPGALTGAVALAAGLAAAARLAGWRSLAIRHEPIVCALHLGYAMLALGLALWGAAGLGLGSEIAALHLLAIGAIGGMTLAVMSRASLGHAGRALVAPWPVALAFALIPAAAGLRWAASTWPGLLYHAGSLAAGALWAMAFTLYLIALWPVWTRPRAAREAAA